MKEAEADHLSLQIRSIPGLLDPTLKTNPRPQRLNSKQKPHAAKPGVAD